MTSNGRTKTATIMSDRARLTMKCSEYECRYENFTLAMHTSVLPKREVIIITNINIKPANVNPEPRWFSQRSKSKPWSWNGSDPFPICKVLCGRRCFSEESLKDETMKIGNDELCFKIKKVKVSINRSTDKSEQSVKIPSKYSLSAFW